MVRSRLGALTFVVCAGGPIFAACSSSPPGRTSAGAVDAGIDASGAGGQTAQDAAPANADSGAEAGAGGACTSDSDCAKTAPPTTPPGCAVGSCNAIAGTCTYHPADQDGDGHYAAGCTGAGVAPGDDCNDFDSTVYPGAWDGPAGVDAANVTELSSCNKIDNDCNGKVDDETLPDGSSCVCKVGTTQPCSEDAKGNPITWPTGAWPAGTPAPNSACSEGIQTCVAPNAAGAWGACAGAVPPAARDCTSSKDNDCDGKPDDTHDSVCECQPSDADSCAGGPNNCPGTMTCTISKSSSSWSQCNAPANCVCTNGTTSSCAAALGARGVCAGGISTCAGGLWGACSISPAAGDTCDSGNDDNCNGIPNEGCACINGNTVPCDVGDCSGQRVCASGNYLACGATQAPVGLAGSQPSGSTLPPFSCTSDCVQSKATCTESVPVTCGPNAFGTTKETDGANCPSGYSVTSCQCVHPDPNQAGGTCTVTNDGNHCHMHQGTSAGVTQESQLITTCAL